MPQQNRHIKWKFASLFNQVHAMLNGKTFTTFLWSSPWAEAANTAMLLENNLITPKKTLSPFQQFFGKGKRNILTLMQKFGKMCIATYKDNSHGAKLANCGTTGIGLRKTSHWFILDLQSNNKKISWPWMWLFYRSPLVIIPRLTNMWLLLWVVRGWMRRKNPKQFL